MLKTLHFVKIGYQGSAFGLGREIEQLPIVPRTALVQTIVEIQVPVILKFNRHWQRDRINNGLHSRVRGMRTHDDITSLKRAVHVSCDRCKSSMD
ncbi:hypothetical protein D3C73_1253370 [compost metagenome]